jgi:two-component system, cell cycle sensor histidine kinase and response regulator CckA
MGANDQRQVNENDPPPTRNLFGDETILVVEDNSPVRKVLRLGLEKHGFHVLEASHPREAIEISASHRGKLDVLVTDVIMPEMHGPELARAILKDHPDVAIIYITASDATVRSNEDWTDGPLRLIQKPFRIKDLASQLRGVLDSKAASSDEPPLS